MVSCSICGFRGDGLADRLGDELRALGARYKAAFDGPDERAVRRRPGPEVWSPIEYACHVRDVLLVQRERVVLACVVERPTVSPMSRDERVSLCRYESQPIAQVLDQVAMAADLLALCYDGLTPAASSRELLYPYPSPEYRTVDWVGVNTLHEGHHHLADIAGLLGAQAGTGVVAPVPGSDAPRKVATDAP